MNDIFENSLIPIMTSNTSPEPYSCNYSSHVNINYTAWKAFNRTNINSQDCWHSGSSVPQWISIDIGSEKIVSKMLMQARNDYDSSINSPSDFNILGSKDNEEWEIISEYTGEQLGRSEIKVFEFENNIPYRYYKVLVKKVYSGSNYASIANLAFFEKIDLTKDITPIMISNNSPSPYVITASSEYNNTTRAAFNCFSLSNNWRSKQNKHINSWICIDYGNITHFSKISIGESKETAANYTPCMPKIFEIQISIDGYNFKTIKEIDLTNEEWSTGEIKEFDLGYSYEFKFIKILINSTFGPNSYGSGDYYAVLGKINIYNNDSYETIPYDSEPKILYAKSTFANKTLPMNITNKVTKKAEDKREGILGMANDIPNYGDLYVVNKEGTSSLTISGQILTSLYEGNVTSGSITLAKDISNFKLIYINIIEDNDYDRSSTCSVVITDRLLYEKKKILLTSYGSISMWLDITNLDTLTITSNNKITIKDIYGLN